MSTFAGWFVAPDPAAGEPFEGWRIIARGGTVDLPALTAPAVGILIEGGAALRREMRSYRPDGSLVRGDDGLPLNASVSSHGFTSAPHIVLAFRLTAAPGAGTFVHASSAWATADSIARAHLAERLDAGETVRAQLLLEHHRYTSKNGPHVGTTVSYSAAGVALV